MCKEQTSDLGAPLLSAEDHALLQVAVIPDVVIPEPIDISAEDQAFLNAVFMSDPIVMDADSDSDSSVESEFDINTFDVDAYLQAELAWIADYDLPWYNELMTMLAQDSSEDE